MDAAPGIRLPGGVIVAPRAALLAALFLLLAGPLGLMLAVQVPLGHVADEPAHVLRAAGLLHGELIGHRQTVRRPDGRVVVQDMLLTDAALERVITVPIAPAVFSPVPTTRQMIEAARALPWDAQPTDVYLPPVAAGYFPLLYMPGALAIGATRLFGGSPYQAFLAMRIANLLLFSLLGSASLLLARQGAALAFSVLLLPMTLNLAASTSQDGLLLATTTLALALLGRAGAAHAVARSGCYYGAATLLGAVALTKSPYLPLVALLLLPLDRPIGAAEARRRIATCLLAALPSLLWLAWAHDVSALPLELASYDAGPLWPGPRPAVFEASDPAAQLRVVLVHPLGVAAAGLRTLWRDRMLLPEQMIGQLGWLNLRLPGWLYPAWMLAAAAAVLADARDGRPTGTDQGWRNAGLAVAVALLGLILVMLSEYLTWSPVGHDWIEGVQGRHLLPLLPVLGFAIPSLPGWRWRRWLLLAPVAVAAADLVVLPRVVIAWYYLP